MHFDKKSLLVVTICQTCHDAANSVFEKLLDLQLLLCFLPHYKLNIPYFSRGQKKIAECRWRMHTPHPI